MNLLMLSGDPTPARRDEGPFFEMLRRFSAYWDRIDVIVPPARGAEARTVHGNVFFHPSPWPKVAQPLFIWHKGRRLLAERSYDLIASHDFGLFYNGLGARLLTWRTGVPVVSEIHHVEGYPRAVTRRERVYRALARRYIPWAARWVAAFRVVNAVEMPGLLRELGVSPERILVLPSLYIDFDVFRPLSGVERDLDLLFVGRLAPNKGLFTVLDALALVRRTHPRARLAIRGSGPLRPALEQYIAAQMPGDAVQFLPRQPTPEAVATLYNRAKMLVCASTAEGGPRVTVEAMACGTPVITTPVGVMAELVRDGENGMQFHWDAGELAGAIRLLLDDPARRESLGAAGRATVQDFAADRVIARYARGYHDLIQRLKETRHPCAY